jgi:hypothetical protein
VETTQQAAAGLARWIKARQRLASGQEQLDGAQAELVCPPGQPDPVFDRLRRPGSMNRICWVS